jgi:hypothetical protein
LASPLQDAVVAGEPGDGARTVVAVWFKTSLPAVPVTWYAMAQSSPN